MSIPNFKPDPDFYQRQIDYVERYLRTERRARSFPAWGSEDRLLPVLVLLDELRSYVEKRNNIVRLNSVTVLPSERIATSEGRPVNVYLNKVGHFEGRYQYYPKTHTIYASVFSWSQIDIPLKP